MPTFVYYALAVLAGAAVAGVIIAALYGRALLRYTSNR